MGLSAQAYHEYGRPDADPTRRRGRQRHGRPAPDPLRRRGRHRLNLFGKPKLQQ